MDSKFTAGPWRKGDQRPFSEDGTTYEVGTDLEVVALAFGEGEEIAEANARLIAAAPELLEALKLMLAAYESVLPGIRYIAVQNYALINDAPVAAARVLARVQGEG